MAVGGADIGQGLGPGLGLGQDSTASLPPPPPSTSSSLNASLTAPSWSTLTVDLTTDLSVFEKHTRSLLQTAREERLHQLAVAFADNEQQQQQQQQQQQGKGDVTPLDGNSPTLPYPTLHTIPYHMLTYPNSPYKKHPFSSLLHPTQTNLALPYPTFHYLTLPQAGE